MARRPTQRKKKAGMSDDSDLSFHSAEQNTPLLQADHSASIATEEDVAPCLDDGPEKLSLSAYQEETSGDGASSTVDKEAPSNDDEDGSANADADGEQRQPKSYRLFHRVGSSFLIPLTDQRGSLSSIALGLFCLALVGTVLGLVMPKESSLPTPVWRTISSIVGYTYFICWSISFYPQVILNYKRKSTAGLSNDFSVLNVAGFACYATYTCCFYWSKEIKEEYQQRNGDDSEITVQSNDVAFAVHALMLCAVQVGQIVFYGGLRAQPLSKVVKLGLILSAVLIATYAALIIFKIEPGHRLLWLDFLYLLSFVKVAISVTKYIPQVILNVRRKSTVGWNIWNIILDFTGGVLSILQLIGDSADISDWSGITGNPAKFALGFVSIIFDIIFFFQHYVLYPEDAHESSHSEALIDNYDTESLI
eukprot:CAMPEP_0197443548 /NCGR_PEP_ID=MMETSP1175-20131217/9260_1 /TAXON_ID=1003142 /ORGANISM="Triceratium dubium, Strain CCMP147" /LENGTH=420 /DNA_ID=CAMNT_0042974195 /DNA_START=1605 /DNA_END=2867 /DNA_ORIENTATION=-